MSPPFPVTSNPPRFGITPAHAIFASMAGHVVIQITERLGGGEPLRIAYAVAEPNQHRAVALFKRCRPGCGWNSAWRDLR